MAVENFILESRNLAVYLDNSFGVIVVQFSRRVVL